MDWNQVLMIIGSNVALMVASIGVTISLFLWARTESKNVFRAMDAKIEANLLAIREEMKDFHGRLCAIEERYRRK